MTLMFVCLVCTSLSCPAHSWDRVRRVKIEMTSKRDREAIPGLANVDDIDTVGTSLPEVRLHVNLKILGAEMGLRGQEHLDVLAGRVEDGGEVSGSHFEYLLPCLRGLEEGLEKGIGGGWEGKKKREGREKREKEKVTPFAMAVVVGGLSPKSSRGPQRISENVCG